MARMQPDLPVRSITERARVLMTPIRAMMIDSAEQHVDEV